MRPYCWGSIPSCAFIVKAANPMLLRSRAAMMKRMKTKGIIRVCSLRIVCVSRLPDTANLTSGYTSVALNLQDVREQAVGDVHRLEILGHSQLMGLSDVVRIDVVAPFAEPSQYLAVPIEFEHHTVHPCCHPQAALRIHEQAAREIVLLNLP